MKIKTLLKIDTGLLLTGAIVYGLSRVEHSMSMNFKELFLTIAIMAVGATYGILHAYAAEECEQ